MQYFKHKATGQVYGASERTIPPVSFYEGRETEFRAVPAPKPKATPKGGGQGDGDQAPKE